MMSWRARIGHHNFNDFMLFFSTCWPGIAHAGTSMINFLPSSKVYRHDQFSEYWFCVALTFCSPSDCASCGIFREHTS